MPSLGAVSNSTSGGLLDIAAGGTTTEAEDLTSTGSGGLGTTSAADWFQVNVSSSSWLPSTGGEPDLVVVTGFNGSSVTGGMDVTSTTTTPVSVVRPCEDWQAAQHTLFQTANLCCAAAFLVPHNFRLSILIMRSILCGGYLMFAVWAGVYICAPDIFAWNLAFMAANVTHVAFLSWKNCPPRINPELRELYTKLFLPLKMDRKNFQELVGDSNIFSLDEGIAYAVEDSTPADERLSILLRGRLKVTCEDTHLHYIYPNHFIDSPEWESCPLGSEQLFQVTITAVEPCRYLCWSRRRLQQLLKSHGFLDVVIYNLVGKDITYKLYSLNETLNPRRHGPRGSVDWSSWRDPQVPRSLSVDAVHTGLKGQVRSHLWPAHARRNSSACSDSIGSSPARQSRYSHLSDPGPYRGSPYRQSPVFVRHVSPLVCGEQSSHLPLATSVATKSHHQVSLESSYPLHVAFETPV